VIALTRWPRWRFEEDDEAAQEAEQERLKVAKAEAAEALAESYQQLERVQELQRTHEPTEAGLNKLRQANRFAEGFLRAIREGR